MTNHTPFPAHDHVDPPHLGSYGAPCCCCGARWVHIAGSTMDMFHRSDCAYLAEAYPDGDTDLSPYLR